MHERETLCSLFGLRNPMERKKTSQSNETTSTRSTYRWAGCSSDFAWPGSWQEAVGWHGTNWWTGSVVVETRMVLVLVLEMD